MFQFTTKLRRLKTVLRQLHLHHTSSITHRVAKAKTNWEAAQFYLDQHPTSSTAQSTEREMVAQYMQLCKDEESYFKQKSRVQWLQLGDRNTSFFHKSLLHRQVRNKIHSLQDENGTLVHDPHDIGKLASTYFENILTATHPTLNAEIKDIFPNTISEASKSAALTPITDDDIKEALFSIPDSKAPGPDGYNALFYKTSWDIIRLDFLAAKGQWNFPTDTPILQNNWNSIVFNPKPWLEDTYMWKGHSSGKFSIASAWELLRDKRPLNNLHKLLWFSGHIPRQSFILWLAGIGRLRTMDRLQTVGIIRNATCILCSCHIETHDHLFFACPITKTVWETVNERANIYWPCTSWQNLLQWASATYTKKNDIQHTIARLMLSATVYLLWQKRNKRVFNNHFQSTTTMVEEVFQLVRTTISTMKFKDIIPITICHIWGIMDLHHRA
ncbi:hypothetical protein NC653_026591 [Populus alba x Populus x berolinensis]|uniref:Reverse transcriptase zinc-binding domain-containing protein n=1 Tax=Populus alba x Populus x berolinensis TaxID=444605 RepID=A0AAD6ME07_9ROSI|nr:hypothetical protein NC653_026591 [Populus alba x Populus x berolinensis]